MEEIKSINNQKVIEWNKLKQKKYRDETGLFLVESKHLVEEAIRNNLVDVIISTKKEEYDVESFIVSRDVLNKLSFLKSPNIIAICHKKKAETYQGNILIVDEVQDPNNLGAIIRSCVAFNIHTLVLSESTVDLYNEKVIKTSCGQIFNINIIRRDLKEFIIEIKEKGYKVLSTNMKGSLDGLKDNFLKAIVVGNEGNGIRNEIVELCDDNISIPINDVCESLNVVVATSIILYEMRRFNE